MKLLIGLVRTLFEYLSFKCYNFLWVWPAAPVFSIYAKHSFLMQKSDFDGASIGDFQLGLLIFSPSFSVTAVF